MKWPEFLGLVAGGMITGLLVCAAVGNLSYTLPERNAISNMVCAPDTTPLTDLNLVMAYGVRRGSVTPVLLRTKDVTGREGMTDTMSVPVDDEQWTIYLVTEDFSSNVSCWSNPFGIGQTVNVPPLAPVLGAQWFDVVGRRLPGKPTESGVYFMRVHGRTRQITILH